MGRIGGTELLVILLVALLIFGPSKLADLGKSLGEGLKNFKKGISSDDDVRPPAPPPYAAPPPAPVAAPNVPPPAAPVPPVAAPPVAGPGGTPSPTDPNRNAPS
jgi:sec-independent protein translocase protein TatA